MYKTASIIFLSIILSGCMTQIASIVSPKSTKKELPPEEVALKKEELDDALDYFSRPMKVREFFAFLDVEKLVLYKKDGYVKLDLHKYKKDKPVIPVKAYLDCTGKTIRGGFHSTYIRCSFERYNERLRRRSIIGSFSVSVANQDHEVTVKKKTWHSAEKVMQVKKGDMVARYWANGKHHTFIVDFDDSPLVPTK